MFSLFEKADIRINTIRKMKKFKLLVINNLYVRNNYKNVSI